MSDLLTSQSAIPIYGLLIIMVLMVAAGYLLARAIHDGDLVDREAIDYEAAVVVWEAWESSDHESPSPFGTFEEAMRAAVAAAIGDGE